MKLISKARDFWYGIENHRIGRGKLAITDWDEMKQILGEKYGTRVKFWHDHWCGDTPLKEVNPELFSIAQDRKTFGLVLCLSSFMDLLYSTLVSGMGEVKLSWGTMDSKDFTVKRFYRCLSSPPSRPFPKCIWKARVPPCVAFFSWSATLGKILTIGNLRRRSLILVDWCCMCKESGEIPDHLMLHCKVARELWDMVFGLFGVHWVMPRTVLDLFSSWQGRFERRRNAVIWRVIPHRVFWCLWRERNAHHFEDTKRTIPDLKLHFFSIIV